MKITIDIRKIPGVQAFLTALPRGSMRAAIKAFGDYILGDDSHGLRHMVAYKYISRATAYGKSFVSDKQRRWFYAALAAGEIHPGSGERHDTTRGWTGVASSDGYSYRATAKGAAAYFTMSDQGQSRQAALVGHRKASDVVRTNISGGLRAAVKAVNRWLADNLPG